MVRNYKRKTQQHSWSEESMALAILDVRNNVLSAKKASSQYNIPLTTLRRRIKSNQEPESASKKKLGRFRLVFSEKQEIELADYIVEMESRLFGLGTRELRHLAFQFAEKNNIVHSFNTTKGLAGRDWVYGFLSRNKNISLRLPEHTSLARASSFNKYNVASFFTILEGLLEKHKFCPSRIFNCDETGISTVPNKPSKIFSKKGKKQVGSLASAERGTLTTAEICFNAVGFYIPPLLIFPRVRKCPDLEQGLPPESVVAYHPSGWMQSDIFSDIWFDHFLKYAKPTETDPVLLIFDGHATHTKNLKLVEKARANHVIIVVIPPHTSHRLQPLDVAFMFPLNTYYGQETKKWLINNPGKAITLYQVGKLFGNAFKQAATAQNAINGFKATGIYPYNPDIFPEDAFKPSETTDKVPEEERPKTPEQVEPNQKRFAEINLPPQPESSRVRTPSPVVCSVRPRNSHATHCVVEDPCYYSLQDISALPKVSEARASKRKIKRGKTMVLTATPNYEELKTTTENKIPKKQKQMIKRNLLKVKKTKKEKKADAEENTSSDSSAEVELASSDDSDSDLEFYPKPKGFYTEKVDIENLNYDDFILTELTSDKMTRKQFLAKIISIEKIPETKIVVSFLRQYRQSADVFVFPEIKDISEVVMNEVLGKVKIEILRHGKIKIV